jgi:hypothetical protein
MDPASTTTIDDRVVGGAGPRRSGLVDVPMGDLVLTTYDSVPPPPRGFVRDIRVRWALEEAKLPYRVESTSRTSRSGKCRG